MGNTMVIIDGNSLINRAFYAMQRPMLTKDGIYTQGVYGFINMLHKIETDYTPDYLAVAFDLKGPTFRHQEYDAYKAGRKPMPPELVMQMPILKDVLHAMRIKTLELEGFEADDIIGTLAREAEEAGLSPLIITGDRDAFQLATKKTKILFTKKGISAFDLLDYDKMVETYQLTPTQFIDLKGLMGDKSDNIPGIPGIGEKTGIKLLTQFGSVEELLARSAEIDSEKLRIKVEENAQLALMSKRLATINTHVPLTLNIEEMRLGEPDYDRLIDLYTKLEFKSFLKRLTAGAGEPETETTFAPLSLQKHVLTTAAALEEENTFADGAQIMLTVFGRFDHVQPPLIEGIVLADETDACYLDWQQIGGEVVIAFLQRKAFQFIGHDLKDALYALFYYGLNEANVAFDTAIAAYVLDVAKNRYDLQTMALEILHAKIPAMEEFLAERGQIDMFTAAADQYLAYITLLLPAVLQIMEKQKAKIEEEGLSQVLYTVELPLIEVLAAMEVEGVRVNRDFLDTFGTELQAQVETLKAQIYAYAGRTFNINSPQQLGEILFETLHLPSGKKTKRGYSTSADILEKLRPLHPIVDAVLTYRNLTKLNSTYVEGMKPLICADGKIRAHFQQTVTATGRISCTEPNLQNIPIRQDLGRKLRKAFVASDEAHILVGADYSQIELRVLAHLSHDPVLIEAFNHGDDIHKLTASRVLGIPFDEVTAEQRSRAKAVNFGVIYGMSSFGLSENLQISRKEAEAYIHAYFLKHQQVKLYMDEQIERCKALGYTETIMGRKRAVPEISASAYMVRQAGERLAMNSPIQGSAADIIKLAMIHVYRELREKFPNSKLILQVHDELIINAATDDLAGIQEMLVRNMEEAMTLEVKLTADMHTAYSWYDLK